MSALIHRDVLGIFDCKISDFEAEFETLKKIKTHDEYTYLHSLNVARLSVNLGRRLGFETDMIVNLGWAALLHDIGKLHVPIEILNKAKKFSAEELAVMQSHPVEALSAFARHQPVTIERLQRLSAAFEHHQRFDLKGYPAVQRKMHLHPYSRIVAITDTFDAMTTDRIYQRRMLPDVALKLMSQGFGTIFDPTVLQAFITSMGAYPVGTTVRLNDTRLGVVISYDDQSGVDRPRVRIVKPKDEGVIDLMNPLHKTLRITQSEFPEDFEIDVQQILEQRN